MKRALLMVLVTCIAGCARSPEQVIEKMKAAACKGDTKAFFGFIDLDTVVRNFIVNNGQKNGLGAALVNAASPVVGDTIRSRIESEINAGQKNMYCNLRVINSEKTDFHAKYVIDHGEENRFFWELHKDDAGFRVVTMVPFRDFMDFSWGDNISKVKSRGHSHLKNSQEVNLESETRGHFELQSSNVAISDGLVCSDVAFVFFDDKLRSVLYSCAYKVEADRDAAFKKVVALLESEYGRPKEKPDGILEWSHAYTQLRVVSYMDEKIPRMQFIAKDSRVDINDELAKREKKK